MLGLIQCLFGMQSASSSVTPWKVVLPLLQCPCPPQRSTIHNMERMVSGSPVKRPYVSCKGHCQRVWDLGPHVLWLILAEQNLKQIRQIFFGVKNYVLQVLDNSSWILLLSQDRMDKQWQDNLIQTSPFKPTRQTRRYPFPLALEKRLVCCKTIKGEQV